MPPLVTHLALARRAAERLGDASLVRSGAYLLGAASPDIRVLTGWDRRRTHFFDLANYEHQESVSAFFLEHRHLRRPDDLNPETRDWTSGFLTHLVLDEQYITAVYRPCFGAESRLGGSERANVLDRVLQYELDRRAREDRAAMAEAREALFASALDIDCGFIDRPTLERWRDVCASVTEHPPDWERFRYTASRHLRRAGIETEGDWHAFLEQVPGLLDEIGRSVSMAQMEAFFDKVSGLTAAALREFLGCE